MKYIELTIITTDEAEELVSFALWNHTDSGVAVSSLADAIKNLDSVVYDYVDDSVMSGKAGVSIIKAYFPENCADEKIKAFEKELSELKENSELNFGTPELIRRQVDGDDWDGVWKKHFKPHKLGKVTVCPAWLEPPKDRTVIMIDLDMAFGTGEHETTSMVVEEMQPYIFDGCSVCDVGTGSGILGIAAAALGAGNVVMTDVDESAVRVAEKNAVRNGVDDKCKIICTGEIPSGEFDLVLANITAEVHILLAENLSSAIKENGIAVLSGILSDRAEKVERAFYDCKLEVVKRRTAGEWCALVLKKSRVS